MYFDWPSELMPHNGYGDEFAISAFKDIIPYNVGKDFVAGTARHLYEGLGLNLSRPASQSNITHDKQLQIIMPAIGYGLNFQLSEHDILRNCVYIYNEWLSALLPESKPSVPIPIKKDPNHYAKIIINHFYYLFVPRSNQAVDEINRQALLCHKVLRTLQDIAKTSKLLHEDTWQTLLLFLLHINSALLSPPSVKNDAGELLGERVLSVLFEIWLLACGRCFPPPPLWNALRECCQKWRHRAGLIEQWNKISLALTTRLLAFMYEGDFVKTNISEEQRSMIPSDMSRDCIAQVWFRMLHIIGNPVDLNRQMVISKTPAFLKFAITSEYVIEPSQHPCLANLPALFSVAMKGVSDLVDAFLGVANGKTDPMKVKDNYFSSFDFKVDDKDFLDIKKIQAKGKPKCNSILHLFGPWLFEAALINCSLTSCSKSDYQNGAGPPAGSVTRRPTSVYTSEQRKSSDSSYSSEEKSFNLNPLHFEAGRAEALGALCRIFCAKKTGEEILPIYLARFYLAIKEGLCLDKEIHTPEDESKRTQLSFKRETCSETAASILLNGTDLFRLDLEGVAILVPNMIKVLNAILFEYRDIGVSAQSKNVPLLRRAATDILLSLLPLPLHFMGLGLKDLGGGSGAERIRLSHLRPHLVNHLSGALQVETDATNIQMLLAGLVFCVQDATLCESMECQSQQALSSDSREHHIVSSAASDTLSSLGADTSSLLGDASIEVSETSSTTFPPAVPKHFAHSDTAIGLYVRAIYLVSHCLMSSWTKDVNVSLAGLELLSSLALLNFGEQAFRDCKCAVRWLCDYIVYQCSRPPQAHSKDLHSMIVAAFHCASVWLIAHPYLLGDQECLATVLEVIELGISGSKSQVRGAPSKFKHQKELKPASMRVRDAAEALLSCVLSQVGSFPSVCGVESLSSLLDEVVLLKHCNSYGASDHLTKETAIQQFRYFVTQNSILLALLEQPLVNHEDPQPTVTALIRGPFGRSAWTLQLRHLPRHKSSTKLHVSNPGRPLPLTDCGSKQTVKHKYFPDCVDRIPMCKADKSVPSLEQVIYSDESSARNLEKLLQIVDHQVAFEQNAQRQMENQRASCSNSVDDIECTAPPLCQEFQTARLLLSHLGLLSIESLMKNSHTSTVPQLLALDSSKAGFCKDLELLDVSNNRTVDTVHIFYVKPGQDCPKDILLNVSTEPGLHPHFSEFIEGLGWPVSVRSHPGWTGHISTSFLAAKNIEPNDDSVEARFPYNGRTNVLYWTDALSEIAFLVPCSVSISDTFPPNNLQPAGAYLDAQSTGSGAGSEKSDSLPPMDVETEASSLSSHTSLVSGGSENRSRRFGRQMSSHTFSNHRVFIVWIESIDDAYLFPTADLIPLTMTGLEAPNWKEKDTPACIIFIHPLTNGLFRIKLVGHLNKLNLAGPLVNGQVVSRRVLGTLVRQTALNMCRRRRLESDSCQLPHVRRKFKIQDMVQKYHSEMNEAEFYTHLFTSPLS